MINTLRDQIQNENIQGKLEVASLEDKMRETCLSWFGHVQGGKLGQDSLKGTGTSTRDEDLRKFG